MVEGRFDATFFQNMMAGDGVDTDTAAVEVRVKQFIADHDIQLRTKYQEKLGITKEPDAPVISLDQIPADDKDKRMAQLQAKAEEYYARVVNKIKTGSRVRRLSVNSVLHTLYKRDALKLLLHYGSLNTYAFSRAVVETIGAKRVGTEFQSACGVIEDYVRHGEVVGGMPGTGLPKIK